MDRDRQTPLPSENDTEDTSQIRWTIDDITVIAERNKVGQWNVYAMEKDIIISDVTKNVSSQDLLFVVQEYKNRYHRSEEFTGIIG